MDAEPLWEVWADFNGLPRPSAPAGRGVIRRRLEDFVVEELPVQDPDGQGEHLWLWIEKRAENTEYVARRLARCAGVGLAAVSYAGRKDRYAVARQWFSIHLPGSRSCAPPPGFEQPSMRILRAERSAKKLRTGALRGNRFEIRLREVEADRQRLDRRLAAMASEGVPNYFGPQRFGRDKRNLAQAMDMFAGRRVRDRKSRGLYLSAARSALFNGILAARVEARTWNTLLPGEAVMLDGVHSYFVVDRIDAPLQRRLAARDVHPSGALWGSGEPPTRGEARQVEESLASRVPGLTQGLAAAGLRQERRPLRLIPQDFSWHWEDENTLCLRFVLPAGAFATAVLRDCLVVQDVSADAEQTGAA